MKKQLPNLALAALEDRVVMNATVVDLTTHGSSGQVGDARFVQYDARPTGTGHIQSFLRVQGASAKGLTQQGYNTDARPLQYDENKSPQFTRSVQVSEVPSVELDGTVYKEFLLDINQKSSQPLLSLDQLQFFVGHAGNLTGYNPTTHALPGTTRVYDLNPTAGDASWVKMDYRLNTGSGSGDVLVYVPAAAFAGGEFVYLYSKFGGHYAANSGFQEWAHGTSEPLVTPPPPPTTAPTTPTGTISGTIFNDVNANRIKDEGELGVANAIVFQDANGNGLLDDNESWTVTSGTGFYQFKDLVGGQSYTLRVITDPDLGASQQALSVFVNFGEDLTNQDLGIFLS